MSIAPSVSDRDAMSSSGGATPAPRDLAAQLHRVRLESDTLYRVIGVVASAPDLDRVLSSIVDLLTEATDCHACFVYLREGRRLRLRAASPVYAHLTGRIEFGLDEGLAGWVARHRRPAFIRDNALADPRMKYVPEIEEERFQSIVAVPVPARSGEAMGVVVLHTQAPREFDEGALNFLAHTASLVAGAIENARLYEETRRRVDALTALAELSQDIVAVSGRREGLYDVVTAGVRRLLGCNICQLHLLDPETGRPKLAATDPPGESAGGPDGTAALLELLRHPVRRAGADAARALAGDKHATTVLAARVAAGDEQLGIFAAIGRRPFGEDADGLLGAVAHQVALALKQVELIERLTEENIVRDLFEALAAGALDVAEDRARAARCDLDRSHVLVHVELAPDACERRAWPEVAERAEQRLRWLAPGAVCDVGRESLRALVPLPAERGDAGPADLDRQLSELGAAEHVLAGRSAVRRGAADGHRGLREAADAVHVARALLPSGGALSYGALGAYRYLVRMPLDDAPEDRHGAAVQRLVEYDRRRRTQLVQTLEQYLSDRRSITTTARALYIHPNTLRQRLGRIEELSGLDLGAEDLLSLELALKLARLRATLNK
jgi:GAF domain-containing protein